MFRLFLLDIYVSRLELTENAYKDTEDDRLLVRLNFINLPTLEVEERDRRITRDNISYEFYAGQAMHFTMKPDELISRMKRTRLKIGVYRKDDCFPICYASTHFYGCVCNLVAEAIENEVPFELKGPFLMVDPGETVAGKVYLDVYLRSLGRHSITQYALGADHFLVKTERCAAEYKCAMDGTAGMIALTARESNEPEETENFIKDIVSIAPSAGRLASGKPPKQTKLTLEIFVEPPKPSKEKSSGKKEKKRKKK